MGLIMQQMNETTPFPPVINPCPDNWTVKGNTCVIPTNDNTGKIKESKDVFLKDTHGISDIENGKSQLGTSITNPLSGTAVIDFNNTEWNKTGSGICYKKKWANNYLITWDGITNAVC
jgi:hypothetical protein